MELSQEQKVAHDALINFIKGKSDKKMYLLEGYAGTGKTYTITQIVNSLLTNFEGKAYSIVMSAPTHKAVKVLKKFSTLGTKISFSTIHSLLGLQEVINNTTGKVTFERAYNSENEPRIAEFDVVLLDEASMLQDELFTYMMEYKHNIKYVFIGDPVQIPPVGKLDAIPFNSVERGKYEIGRDVLTEIRRQKNGNQILEYATAIRKDYKYGNVKPVSGLDEDGYGIEVLGKEVSEEVLLDHLRMMFCTKEFAEDADYAKVIAWRNVTVNSINTVVRELIYKKKNLPVLMVGDKLVMDKPVFSVDAIRRKIIMYTSDEAEVKSFTIEGEMIAYNTLDERKMIVASQKFIKYYDTIVEFIEIDGTKKQLNIRVVHDDSIAAYDAILKTHADAAKNTRDYTQRKPLWRRFYDIQKGFAQVKYNYAITSHKAQGSTYVHCMSMEWDINVNYNIEERNRIKYVAATRPSKRLIIVN